MSESLKDMKVIVIIFIIASFVSFGSIAALFIYSVVDHGTPVNETLEVDDVSVSFYINEEENLIKLQFVGVKEDCTRNYKVKLISSRQKVIDTHTIAVNHTTTGSAEYVFEPNVLVSEVYYFMITK